MPRSQLARFATQAALQSAPMSVLIAVLLGMQHAGQAAGTAGEVLRGPNAPPMALLVSALTVAVVGVAGKVAQMSAEARVSVTRQAVLCAWACQCAHRSCGCTRSCQCAHKAVDACVPHGCFSTHCSVLPMFTVVCDPTHHAQSTPVPDWPVVLVCLLPTGTDRKAAQCCAATLRTFCSFVAPSACHPQ